MIVKERTIPLRIQQIKALLRRLPKDHRKRPQIEEDLAKREAGFRGEQSLDYHLKFLNHKEYYILHDLRLHHSVPFQIDTLILSPNFFLIIEVKNISGTLIFEKYSKQLIRLIEGNEEGFPNPLTQVQRQQQRLKEWMDHQKLLPVPIEYLVVVSKSSTILKTSNGNYHIYNRVLHADHLEEKVKELEAIYDKPILEKKQIQEITDLLMKNNFPITDNILQQYGIDPSELIKGVQCPNCNSYPMVRKFSTWYCSLCKFTSKKAHIQALNDYFLLINSSISNRAFREFLLISSRSIASKLLASMNLPFSGTNKGRIYHRPEM